MFNPPHDLVIRPVASARMSAQLRDDGYCPIECAFGAESVVDELLLDHHGIYSELSPVSIRAFRDAEGMRRADPRFVVAGPPDSDASFAIAALCGALPAAADCVNVPLAELAELVARKDSDPIGLDLCNGDTGPLLLLFDTLRIRRPEPIAWLGAVAMWQWLLTSEAAPLLAKSCVLREQQRHAASRAVAPRYSGKYVALVEANFWGFDVWYDEFAPIIVRYSGRPGVVQVGCQNRETACALLGEGGLRNVYARLQPSGWGGRDTVGGSPRGLRMSADEAAAAAAEVGRFIEDRHNGALMTLKTASI